MGINRVFPPQTITPKSPYHAYTIIVIIPISVLGNICHIFTLKRGKNYTYILYLQRTKTAYFQWISCTYTNYHLLNLKPFWPKIRGQNTHNNTLHSLSLYTKMGYHLVAKILPSDKLSPTDNHHEKGGVHGVQFCKVHSYINKGVLDGDSRKSVRQICRTHSPPNRG